MERFNKELATVHKNLLSLQEFSAALQIHPVTARKWVSSGFIDSLREGIRVFIPAREALSMMIAHCEECGHAFHPGRYLNGRRKFCSEKCRALHFRKQRNETHENKTIKRR